MCLSEKRIQCLTRHERDRSVLGVCTFEQREGEEERGPVDAYRFASQLLPTEHERPEGGFPYDRHSMASDDPFWDDRSMIEFRGGKAVKAANKGMARSVIRN